MSFRLLSAGLFLSAALVSSNAYAADLGGDCCADLEERIAELEVTTARKGNRKVSLQIYGQVNTGVMFWDNGGESNAYVVDNDASSTRLGFRGKAKIDSDWEAGFRLELEFQSAESNDVSDDDDDESALGGVRQANWYLKSNTYGKITVGQGDSATSGITEIDLSGTNVVAIFDNIKAGEDLFVYANGARTGRTFDNFTADGNHEFNRINVVRYDTPTFAGFVGSAAWGEDDTWDVALRYAGEFQGFKLAAGVGYGETTDNLNGGSNDNDCDDFADTGDCKIANTYASASVIHSATGLFVTGGYAYREADDNQDATENYQDNNWFVRGGISQKWISLGKTAIYGEYQEYERDFFGNAYRESEVIGAGIVQKIDAAAMELYLGYRHISVDDETNTNYEDLDVVLTGARIKF